jgi:hypothetical protein
MAVSRKTSSSNHGKRSLASRASKRISGVSFKLVTIASLYILARSVITFKIRCNFETRQFSYLRHNEYFETYNKVYNDGATVNTCREREREREREDVVC